MEKLSNLKLEDWRVIAAAKGIEPEEGKDTINELVAMIAIKCDIKVAGDDKKARTARKKAVYDHLVIEADAVEAAGEGGEEGNEGAGGEAGVELTKEGRALATLSVEKLAEIIATENMGEASDNKMEMVLRIDSLRTLRGKTLTEQKSKAAAVQTKREQGRSVAPTIDAEVNFTGWCANVVSSFSSGIFNIRRPSKDEVMAHIGDNHGYPIEITETKGKGKEDKGKLFLTISAKIKKGTITSDRIEIAVPPKAAKTEKKS